MFVGEIRLGGACVSVVQHISVRIGVSVLCLSWSTNGRKILVYVGERNQPPSFSYGKDNWGSDMQRMYGWIIGGGISSRSGEIGHRSCQFCLFDCFGENRGGIM